MTKSGNHTELIGATQDKFGWLPLLLLLGLLELLFALVFLVPMTVFASIIGIVRIWKER